MNRLRKAISAFIRRDRDRRIIMASRLFDRDWYVARHARVGASGMDPLAHYLLSGAAEGLNPNPLFDTGWYLTRYPDVRANGLNPLVHYLRSGAAERRFPHPLFDSGWYLDQNPDVRAAGMNPLEDYLQLGGRQGRDPNPLFDGNWYLDSNPEVRAAGTNPLVHYVEKGAAEGRAPNRLFNSQWYLEQYPQAAAAGMGALAHYLHFGLAEGCDPNPLFDAAWYRAQDPDAILAQLNPLAHYLRSGAAEGRAPNPQFKGIWYLERFVDRAAKSKSTPQWRLPQGAVAWARGGRSVADHAHAPDCHLVVIGAERSTAELTSAVADAATERRHLLVVMTGTAPAAADIIRLASVFDADPMIGYAVPRFSDSTGLILPLSADMARGELGYDPAILAHLPRTQLVPEFLSGCVMVRRELVANFPDLGRHFSTTAGLLRALMAWGRRLGYRAAIANHVIIPNAARSEAYPALDAAEHEALVRLFPDVLAADTRFNELPCHRREALAARALSCGERRVLIDCTGMHPYYDGTSECILGVLDGLAAIGPAGHVHIVASQAAADFHKLRQRYGAFQVVSAPPKEFYTIAIRLSQPWTLESIAELHEHALYVVFLMLDTIAWDIVYAATPGVERAWAFAAAHADGLLYDSAFTRDRFGHRFSVAPHVRELATHLSCHFDDYLRSPAVARGDAGHILLLGNAFEHKGMAQALDLLPVAFPDEEFVAIGCKDPGYPNVRSFKSGRISADEMGQLYADARMLIFPSFYEGFGFPIVKGLAHGLDVVARRSDLLCEIAGQCAERGRVIPFDDPASLIDAVGRTLAGASVETIPLGAGLEPGRESPRWRDTAARIVQFIDDTTATPSLSVHDRREAALRYVWPAGYSAFKTSKASP
jgi:glycosyltransferase involved in cell wall biosynthesis